MPENLLWRGETSSPLQPLTRERVSHLVYAEAVDVARPLHRSCERLERETEVPAADVNPAPAPRVERDLEATVGLPAATTAALRRQPPAPASRVPDQAPGSRGSFGFRPANDIAATNTPAAMSSHLMVPDLK